MSAVTTMGRPSVAGPALALLAVAGTLLVTSRRAPIDAPITFSAAGDTTTEHANATEAEAVNTQTLGDKTIVVIDDAAFLWTEIALLAKVILPSVKVFGFGSCEAALASDLTEVHLVFLDNAMGKGVMAGTDPKCVKGIKAKWPMAFVIGHSAGEEVGQDFLKAGAEAFLEKGGADYARLLGDFLAC